MESQSDRPSKANNPRKRRNNATSSTEVTPMDEHIWKELPEDVMERVIARLPIATFFRFRSVSQKWNSLLHSHTFLQHCGDVAGIQPWFFTFYSEVADNTAVYDPLKKKWHYFTEIERLELHPAASAGGLVCCVTFAHNSMFVCNPLTQTRKTLPDVSPWKAIIKVGMVLNQDPGSSGYRIIRVSHEGKYEVYDSLKNSWLTPGAIPANFTLPIWFSQRSNTVSIGSDIYFLREHPHAIVSYSFASGTWEQFLIPTPTDSTEYFLAESVGRILLVGLVKRTGSIATAVCVWKLDRTMLLWKELDKMPSSWCSEFNGKSMDLFCLGNTRLIMILLRWQRRMNRIFTFDAVSLEWSKVPNCLVPRQTRWRRPYLKSGIVFSPCLAASP